MAAQCATAPGGVAQARHGAVLQDSSGKARKLSYPTCLAFLFYDLQIVDVQTGNLRYSGIPEPHILRKEFRLFQFAMSSLGEDGWHLISASDPVGGHEPQRTAGHWEAAKSSWFLDRELTQISIITGSSGMSKAYGFGGGYWHAS